MSISLAAAQNTLQATVLGFQAQQVITQAKVGKVWGATSRGVFVHFAPGWVIFLSRERFRGPLTVNMEEWTGELSAALPGAQVRVEPGGIYFPAQKLRVSMKRALAWAVPLRRPASFSGVGCWRRMEALYRQVYAARAAEVEGIFALLGQGRGDLRGETGMGLAAWRALLAGEQGICVWRRLAALLGLGGGLTPVGDDLAVGYLLALNRWGDVICPELDVSEANQGLQRAANEKTLTLSANLVACAALGQVDERLALALDGVMDEKVDLETCARSLLSWGNSSGIGVLLGASLAFYQAG